MIYRVLIFILLFVVGVDAQIRRLVIDDFSGGINQAAPSQVQPNQCYDMVNFDVTVRGALVPRRGFDYLSLAKDSTVGTVITGLVAYNRTAFKHLLIQRGEDTTLWSHVKAGTKDSVLTTLNAVINSARPQTGVTSFYYKGNTYIASAGSEMMVYDGTKMWPARPLGPGQPSAVAIDNTSHTTTLTANYVQYRYSDSADCIADPDEWHNNLSIPSFPVHVYNGAVLVTGLYPVDSCETQPRFRLFRSINGGSYHGIPWPNSAEGTFLDTMPATDTLNAPTYPYGYVPRCFSSEDDATPDCLVSQSSPGAIRAYTAPASTSPTYWITYPDSIAPWTGNQAQVIGYSVVFQDSAGRQSYMAPPKCVNLSSTGKYKVALTGIPTPLSADTFIVKKKLLLRSFGRACDGSNCPGAEGDFDTTTSGDSGCRDPGNWYVVDTLAHGVTTFIDSMPCCSLHIPSRLYCPIDPDSIVTFVEHTDSVGSGFPQLSCQDSVITFKPSQVIQRGSQAFAIGDPEHPDRIYFSTFYDAPLNHGPTTWVADKFWEIPSDQGDWFVRLAVLGDAIYAFRQSSIVKISGFTFYQYQIEMFSNQVGAIAPRSVVSTLSHIYFADASGIYVTNGGEPIKISQPIDSIWTAKMRYYCIPPNGSYGDDCRRLAIGTIVNGEYWLQGYEDTGTLIFNEGNGSWRRSDIIYTDIISYNTDTTNLDFVGHRTIIVRNDSLFEDGGESIELDYFDSVGTCSYVSRTLFDGPAREKIHYIDIHGHGQMDSIIVHSYRGDGGRLVGTARSGLDSLYWSSPPSAPDSLPPSVRTRFYIDQILPSYRFEIVCYPGVFVGLNTHNWGITSIVIGWQPWDEGRPR